MTRRTRRTRLEAPQLGILKEAAYISKRAAQHETCIVTMGPLVFFSTETGDAWVLDPGDGLARCLARDGAALPAGITETAETFAVEWAANYRIDGELMTFVERPGRVRTVMGYPTAEIRRAVRKMKGPRLAL